MAFSKKIDAVDTHVCGEPGRVIVGGVADVPGATMLDKMLWMASEADELRKLMLNEPRGYPASNCNLLLPPTHADADAGYIIMEHVEYPAMSGTNTIAVATVLIENRLVNVTEPITELTLESPAGLIGIRAEVNGGKAESITFENVPAFPVYLDETIEVPGIGKITVDVAWGGMFYVIADAEQVGVKIDPDGAGDAVRLGEMIKKAAQEQLEPPVHPEHPEMRGITIGQLSAPPRNPAAHRRNTVIVSTGELDWDRPSTWKACLDRSPCGTGTSAKMAALWAKGELGIGEDFVHESIIGTTFTGRLIRETEVAGIPAVVPTIKGSAWITGFAEYVVDAADPFPTGFTLGDIWAG